MLWTNILWLGFESGSGCGSSETYVDKYLQKVKTEASHSLMD